MDTAALILWILTAAGGFVLLAKWIAKGGARPGGSKFPPPLIFGHFGLAGTGLVLWIIYVANDSKGIGWTAFGFLIAVALLGFTMFARWIPTYRAASVPVEAPRPTPTPGGGGVSTATTTAPTVAVPAERHFPLAIVMGHGLLAATTLVLVIIALISS